MPRKDHPFFKIEIDFFFDNPRFLSLTGTQRIVYLGYWALCVRNRNSVVTRLELEPNYMATRLKLDPRSIRSTLHKCCKNGLLVMQDDGTLLVPGVRDRHKQLRDWKVQCRNNVGTKPEKEGSTREGEGEGEGPDSSDVATTSDTESEQKSPKPKPAKPKKLLPLNGPAVRVATALLEAIRSHEPTFKPKFGAADVQRWARDADLMLRRDGRSVEQVERVIAWAHRGDATHFWRGNILSVAKLRAQFDQLAIKMQPAPAPPPAQPARPFDPCDKPLPYIPSPFAKEKPDA